MNIREISSFLAAASLLVSGVSFGGGTISGTVSFTGTAPKPTKLNRKSDPICAKTEFDDEAVLTSKTGKGQQNVLVRINSAVPGAKVPTADGVFGQKVCKYLPRVLGAGVGPPIRVRNDDLH